MKWRTERQRRNPLEWHRCFAWWPVRTVDGYTVWLERVERRITTRYRNEPGWEYRALLRDPHS